MFEKVIVCHELWDEKDDILSCAEEFDNSNENALVKECDDSEEEDPFGVTENVVQC